MDKARAEHVLAKIDEILRCEENVGQEKDRRFAELGKYLCEARNKGYWRLGFERFERFLEAKFPDSRRKAYYLMSIHDHLKQIPTIEIEELGWSKALELAKVARSEGRHFNCATWLHKAKESTKAQLKEEVYKYFTGEDYEPYEMVYFKLFESQLPVVERAQYVASRMVGTERSRGYCLELTCADFLAGRTEESTPEEILLLVEGLLKLLPPECVARLGRRTESQTNAEVIKQC